MARCFCRSQIENSLFNKSRDKGKQFLPGREGVKGEWEGVEEKVMGGGVGGRNDQNIV
jgi:hypothetical protein